MIEIRKLAIPYPSVRISELPHYTQYIIRKDLEAHAKENGYILEANPIYSKNYIALDGRFCDIEQIYQDTKLEFCEPGQDFAAYEESNKRTLNMVLEDDDLMLLAEKAGEAGLKISELLENFVADLISSSRTNGSDERTYANQWFERCWFAMDFSRTFLSYLCYEGLVDNAVDLWQDIQYYRQLDDLDEEDRLEVQMLQGELADLHNRYLEQQDMKESPLDEDMKDVIEWHEDYKKLSERRPVEYERNL